MRLRRVIVAGGREFLDYHYLSHELKVLLHPDRDEIVSGGARGADSMAIQFATEHGVQYDVMPANWARDGKYQAGKIRNTTMVNTSDVLIAFWDGQSGGTKDTIEKALKKGLHVHVYTVKY